MLTPLLSLLALPAQQPAQQPAQRGSVFLAQRTPAPSSGLPAASPAESLRLARQQHLSLLQSRTANLTAAWQPLGPAAVLTATFGELTGRIISIAVDPNDATGNTVYLGTTGGGVWKSTNAAGPLASASFTPLTDTLPVFSANAGSSAIASLSIGAVAVQPASQPIVIAGTGDPNDATDSYYGEGLLRSTDGGLTWTLIQNSHDGVNGNHSFSGLATAGLAFSTASPSLVVAAMSTSADATLTSATNSASVPGLYYSTDAGLTWQMATISDGATIVQQPQPLGTGQVGNAATSVVWDALRGQFFAAVRGHGYYSSPDGANWTRLTAQPGTGLTTANCPVGVNGVGSSSCPIFRGVITAQPVTGDLYALTVSSSNGDQGLWQDLCNANSGSCSNSAPTFAHRLDNGALDTTGTTTLQQGVYNLALLALPASANGTLLFAGTVDLYRCSLAAGATACTLRNTTNALDGCNAPAGVAPAQHALAGSGTLLYLGNDGGLWRSLDGVAETGSVCSSTDSTHFDNLNAAIASGGSLAQVVAFAQHPTDSNTLLAGLGGNGSAGTSSALQLTAWPQLSAGEGGQPQIDAATPSNRYVAIGAGVNLAACTLGSNCAAANFVPPATIGAAQVANDASLIDAPTLLDPANTSSQPSNLLIGTCRVWRGPATSGSAWSAANAISPAFNNSATPCTASSPLIRSLAAGGPSATNASAQLSGSSVLYAGLAGAQDGGSTLPGHVFVTRSANTSPVNPTWTDIALSPVTNDVADAYTFNPLGYDISALAVDPHDPTGATVYATVMGFNAPHLYRSTDFGAHWLNVSANLPNAPANAVTIDPNDANTVYIALDTGVYVTQGIATCATANCWSVLGTALPNAPITGLAAVAGAPTGDGRSGLLRAATYGRGLWQTPLLTAASLAQPAITISPASLTFPAQQAQTQSPAQTITVTSSGNAPVTFGTPTITGDFAETDTCAGQTLAVGATCTLQIVFAPTTTGTRTGLLTLYANISGGQATVVLNGTGTAPSSIVLTPLSLTFAATIVNQTSAAQIITVANTGGSAATLQTPVITGDFSISANTCTATLAASTACSIAIVFTPTASGARTGTLSVTDSAGTQTAQLTGTGNAPATDTLSPPSLSFAAQQLSTTSAAQQVTLTNAGDVALTLIAASVTGTEFSVVNACGNSLAPHSTCAFNVAFTPSTLGARTATLTITDQYRTQTVALTGTGVAPPGVSLTPTALTFAATGVGLVSPAQTLTLTNNGGVALHISAAVVSSGFVIAANTCPASLAPAAACTLTLVFAPTVAGSATGTLTLTDDAPSLTQTVLLTGTGVDFTLAPNGPTTATLASGGTATYSLLLSSLAGLSGNVPMTCAGAPANSTCTVNPATGSLGGTTLVTVTIQTGITVVDLQWPHRPGTHVQSIGILLALTLPLSLLRPRRNYRQRGPASPGTGLPRTLRTTLLLGFVLAIQLGCGTGRIIPGSNSTSGSGGGSGVTTPSGTYNLTVSGSSAGLTHIVGLTLIVQ
jgi:hypothetical protein